MAITDLLNPERVACCEESSSKKRTLEQLSALLAEGISGLTPGEIFDCLINRERLGSTGLGKGVAIPHGRMKGLEHPVGAFLRLREGVDFDAADHQPVDLLFALLVPEESTEEHLHILAELARIFSDTALVGRLREAGDDAQLLQLLNDSGPRRITA